MNTNLLSLFDTIEIKSTSLIADEDMEQIQNIWSTFCQAFEKLVTNWRTFCKLDQENMEDEYKMNKGYNSYYVTSPMYSEDLGNKLTRCSFTYKYDILHCEKLIKQMCNVVENHIIRFFNIKYGCSLENNNTLSESVFDSNQRYKDNEPDLQIILNDIIRQNNGLSFSEKGEQDTIIGIGQNIGYSQISLSGKTVGITGVVSCSEFSSNHTLYSSSWNKVYTIFEAIAYCFFKTKELYTIIRHDDLSRLENMPVGSAFDFEKKFKLEQVKYLKNSKLVIKFVKPEQAKQFYEFISDAKEKNQNQINR